METARCQTILQNQKEIMILVSTVITAQFMIIMITLNSEITKETLSVQRQEESKNNREHLGESHMSMRDKAITIIKQLNFHR